MKELNLTATTIAEKIIEHNIEEVTIPLNLGAKCNRAIWLSMRGAMTIKVDRLREQADRACGELAYGDVKRLELAMALANRPRLLLMDEPTAGMAPRERIALMALTASIARARRLAVLFTEHDMDVVFTHADRIIVLAGGQLIAGGKPAEVRADARVQEVYLGSGATYAH